MKRVSVKNSVPEVYVKKSRDFQLLCDLFDLVNSGVKFDIDTITHISDTQLCRDKLLVLLQEKLGLRLSNNITDTTLRMILKCFPFIVKHKGTYLGISEMIHLFLNIVHSEGKYSVDIENLNADDKLTTRGLGNYVIAIVTEIDDECLKELDILEDLLRYVVPTGYRIDYSLNISSQDVTNSLLSNTVYITAFNEYRENRVRSNSDNNEFDDNSYVNKSVREALHKIGAVVVSCKPTEEQEDSTYTYVEEELSQTKEN